MNLRHLALATGVAAVGFYAFKRLSSGVSLPDDGSAAPDTSQLDELPLRSLQAGMPSDMHSDADRARPGFADYARGA